MNPKEELNQVDDKLEKIGYWEEPISYFDDIHKRIEPGLEKGCYYEGKRSGLWKIFGVNDNLIQRHTNKNGKRIGEFAFYFHDSNIPKVIGERDDNEKSCGVWTWFHENGNICKIAHYNDGKFNGLYQTFYENGDCAGEIINIK